MKNNRDNRNNDGALEKMNKNNDIWHEVDESTKVLYIVNQQDIQPIIRDIVVQHSKGVIINLFDHPKIKLIDLGNMPNNLANLEFLLIRNQRSLSFVNMPKNLLNLKELFIFSSSLKNFKGLPKELPSLKLLKIWGVSIESLEYLPKSLPKLAKLIVVQTNIRDLKYFPSDVPALKEIYITRNNLTSLKGIPPEIPKLEEINVSNNQIISLEHLPYKFDENPTSYEKNGIKRSLKRKRSFNLSVIDNPIRTFAGIKFPIFFKTMIESLDYASKTFQLCPTGLKLLNTYQKKKNQVEIMKYNISKNEHEFDQVKHEKSTRRATLVEFYSKTPMELAQQYIEKPNSLSDGELERLGWEGGYQERQLLESNFPPDNYMLKEISQRLSYKLPSGLSILK